MLQPKEQEAQGLRSPARRPATAARIRRSIRSGLRRGPAARHAESADCAIVCDDARLMYRVTRTARAAMRDASAFGPQAPRGRAGLLPEPTPHRSTQAADAQDRARPAAPASPTPAACGTAAYSTPLQQASELGLTVFWSCLFIPLVWCVRAEQETRWFGWKCTRVLREGFTRQAGQANGLNK